MKMCRLIAAMLVGGLALAAASEGATIAHWTFDEGSGTTAANSDGSATAKLQFGNSGGPDSADPLWATGYSGSAIRDDKPTSNVSYARNTGGWTATDATNMAPTGSFTIEMFINHDTFSTWGDQQFGLLSYRNGSQVQYVMRSYVHHISGDNLIGIFVENSVGDTNTTFNTSAAGLSMVANQWYYLAAIYDDVAGQLEIVLRDMNDDTTVSTTIASNGMQGITGTPNPLLLIGSEAGGGRSFDGLIDEVRFSDSVVAEGDRLYNPVPEPGTMGLIGLGAMFLAKRKR
ncbi:LamG-like jellyroll fold domain-containing protein [Poriferisphaera sp. WC338]|uniref:LamG-like jellyroll fold domain-containing protein n=1 Tax=Poriferisphaera sp. WC338 TaxID=3425129 RepID=UPI003D81A77F